MATKDKKGNDMENAETYGIAAPQDTAAEFDLVHVDMWQDWCAGASDEMRNWIDAQNFSGQAGSACIPGPDGRMQKAVGLYGKHAVWDGAGLAKIPAARHLGGNADNRCQARRCGHRTIGTWLGAVAIQLQPLPA